ncbi:hypothetical protein [Dyadobacter sp. CY347]|uniref:hypothetical protein n=1 Tax=Dyadobacter sp. CY347 TaxID=2909336 RepID=UPI001F35C8AB|nr:hypothetical protein [Dyadobacter sp. CY347]MCF2490738.1 hypothetical protein [Dyadobacter sp. CY347]
MKYFVLMLVTLVSAYSKAQIPEVDVQQIALISPNNEAEGVLSGASFAACVKVFGKPDSISNHYSEIDADTLKLYRYGKNELYFLKGKLDNWHLLDSKISVGQVGGQTFKVGDKLVPVSGKPLNFKGFQITHHDGVSQNLRYKSASINEVKNGTVYEDSFLTLFFNSKGTLFSISKLSR